MKKINAESQNSVRKPLKKAGSSHSKSFSAFVTDFLTQKEVLRVLAAQENATEPNGNSSDSDIQKYAARAEKGIAADSDEIDRIKHYFSKLLLSHWRSGTLDVLYEMQRIHYTSLKNPYNYPSTLYGILCKTSSESGQGNSVTKDRNAIIAASLITGFAEKYGLKKQLLSALFPDRKITNADRYQWSYIRFLIANWLTNRIPPVRQDSDGTRRTGFADFFFSGGLSDQVYENRIPPKNCDEALAEKIADAARVFPSFRILLSDRYWNYRTETLRLLSDCLKIRSGKDVKILPPMPIVIREIENSLYEITSSHTGFSRYDICIVFAMCGLAASRNADHIIDHDIARSVFAESRSQCASPAFRQFLDSADNCFEKIYTLMVSLNREAAFSALFKNEKAQSQNSDLKFSSKKLRLAFISIYDALCAVFEPARTHDIFLHYLYRRESATIGVDDRDHFQLEKAFDTFLFSAYVYLSYLPAAQAAEEIEKIIALSQDFSVVNRKKQSACIELLSDLLAEGFPLPLPLARKCFYAAYGATAYPQQLALLPQVLKNYPAFEDCVKTEIGRILAGSASAEGSDLPFLEIYPYLPGSTGTQDAFFEDCRKLIRFVWPSVDTKNYRPETLYRLLSEAYGRLVSGDLSPAAVYGTNYLLVTMADLLRVNDPGLLHYLANSDTRKRILALAVRTDYGYRRIDRNYNQMLYDSHSHHMHIPCGAFRLFSQYEFDGTVTLTREERDYYRLVFSVDGSGRYGALQYRLLAYTDFFDDYDRPLLKCFGDARFLNYDSIYDFTPENYAANAAFLRDPRKLQKREADKLPES